LKPSKFTLVLTRISLPLTQLATRRWPLAKELEKGFLSFLRDSGTLTVSEVEGLVQSDKASGDSVGALDVGAVVRDCPEFHGTFQACPTEEWRSRYVHEDMVTSRHCRRCCGGNGFDLTYYLP